IMIVTIVTYIVATQYKNATEKQLRTILLLVGITTLSFEAYKQLVFSYSFDATTNLSSWSYQWYAFPFHFCSIPMYIAPIAAFLRPGKVRQAILNFLGTFGLFGGLAVMIYAQPVFITTIGINIQTMVHHGAQVLLGIFLITSGRVEMNLKAMKGATIVFIIPVLMAVAMNIIFYAINATNLGEFNMFWISPYFPTDLPILSTIKPQVPYPIFVLIYLVGFTFIATLVLSLAIALRKLKGASLQKRRNVAE
ncbi:MAG: hypothetical protein AB7E23_04665, partial [Bacilli bacterium]